MNKKIEQQERRKILSPREVLLGKATFSPRNDIKELQQRVDGLGKELVIDKEQRLEIFKEVADKEKELDKIEQETEEQALESVENFFTKMIGSAREKMKQKIDAALVKIGKVMLKSRSPNFGRKAMILMAIIIAGEAGIAAAAEGSMTDKQIDEAARDAVNDAVTEVMPAEKEVGGKYKYPEDGKYIDMWLKRLAKKYDEFDVEFLENEVYIYNQKHEKDDPQDTKKLLALISEDLAETMSEKKIEETKAELPGAIYKAREEFRAGIKARRIKHRSGSRNIVGLFMRLETAAKNKDWDKVRSLWDTRANYQPDPGSATRSDFDKYDSIWSDVEDLIDYLGDSTE